MAGGSYRLAPVEQLGVVAQHQCLVPDIRFGIDQSTLDEPGCDQVQRLLPDDPAVRTIGNKTLNPFNAGVGRKPDPGILISVKSVRCEQIAGMHRPTTEP